MTNYVIAHVPHAATTIPWREQYSDAVSYELALVTDWATDQMLTADESIVFPFSRLWCDVERLPNDPLAGRGLGLFTTHRLNGDLLREATEPSLSQVNADYVEHHAKVVRAINDAISLMPVCLLDMHSYSVEQARLLGHNEPYPDICLGFDDSVMRDLIAAITSLFSTAGYSVGHNHPYQGALVPAAFSGNADFFGLMIEVNKAVYLDSKQVVVSEKFTKLQAVLDEVVTTIRTWPTGA